MRSSGCVGVIPLLLRLSGAAAQELCSIDSLFSRLSEIQDNAACRSGCSGGTGDCAEDEDWLPGAADLCPPDCGRVFEPLWDRCGDMLLGTGMDIAGMNIFYDHCLTTLYPPGSWYAPRLLASCITYVWR